MKKFLENKKGVHLMGIEQGGEFTLCGWAFDSDENDGYMHGELKQTKKKVVTCEDCVSHIKHCRGVKTRGKG